jgi:hypothetical protein
MHIRVRFVNIAIMLMVIFVVSILFSSIFVQAQSQTDVTEFGNTNYNNSWNVEGGVVVASQFSLQQSLTVNWMSLLTQDDSPPSYIRLGIFSDNNNQPGVCLASTNVVPSQVSFGWYSVPLSNSVTLDPGNYWLTELDSGASVIKFVETPGSSTTVYTTLLQPFTQLNVGSQISAQLTTLSGTLTIVAGNSEPSVQEGTLTSFSNYAQGAQCWTSSSNSNPYPIQTSFQVGTPVYIYWSPYNPSTGAVDVSVYPPSGTPGVTPAYSSFVDITPDQAPESFVPNAPGTWVVSCNGYSTTITITPVNVFDLPEYALGALLAIVACFAAFAVFKKDLRPSKNVPS